MHVPWNFFLVLLGLLSIVNSRISTPNSISSSFILLHRGIITDLALFEILGNK